MQIVNTLVVNFLLFAAGMIAGGFLQKKLHWFDHMVEFLNKTK